MMTVQELQAAIVKHIQGWDAKRGVSPTESRTFTHLVEEVGELAREYVSREERPEEYSEAELINGIGDALMQLVFLAHLRGLDIERIVSEIVATDQPATDDTA